MLPYSPKLHSLYILDNRPERLYLSYPGLDVFRSICIDQSGPGFFEVGAGWADVGDHHCPAVASQRVLWMTPGTGSKQSSATLHALAQKAPSTHSRGSWEVKHRTHLNTSGKWAQMRVRRSTDTHSV